MTIELEDKNGSFEDMLLHFDQLLQNHHENSEVHSYLLRQVKEFKATISQSDEAENGFLAMQASAQELEWFIEAWKAYDDRLYSIACRYFDLCAKSSNTNAMLILAHIYGSQKYGQTDLEKSFGLYHQAANFGNSIAMRTLGILFLNGVDVQRDEEAALNYFLQASKKQDAESMYYLGEMYRTGRVVKKDKVRAKKYFEQSARQGFQKAIMKTQSMTDVEEPVKTPKFEFKPAPVKFVPINYGLSSSQQDHYQANVRQAISKHRASKLRRRRRNSSNSLFQIALVASVAAIIGWIYYADYIPASKFKNFPESLFSRPEAAEVSSPDSTEADARKTKSKNDQTTTREKYKVVYDVQQR